jgi:hypothetical protein
VVTGSEETQRNLELKALAQRIQTLSESLIRYEERQIIMARDLASLIQKLDDRDELFDKKYVLRAEFEPIQRLVWRCVYSAAGLFIAVLTGLAVKSGGIIK